MWLSGQLTRKDCFLLSDVALETHTIIITIIAIIIIPTRRTIIIIIKKLNLSLSAFASFFFTMHSDFCSINFYCSVLWLLFSLAGDISKAIHIIQSVQYIALGCFFFFFCV